MIGEKIAAIQLSAEAGQIGRDQESAQIAALHRQEMQEQLAALDVTYQSQQSALARQLALEDQGSAAYEAILDRETSLAARHTAEVTRLTADGLRQQDNERRADLARLKQEWDGAVNPVVSAFTSGLLKMAEGTQSFAQTMRAIGGQIASDFVTRVIDPMIERWLWKEGQQLLATITGSAQKNVVTAASLAAGTAADAFANLEPPRRRSTRRRPSPAQSRRSRRSLSSALRLRRASPLKWPRWRRLPAVSTSRLAPTRSPSSTLRRWCFRRVWRTRCDR